MKIYIVGSVASGKTTLAKRISSRTHVAFYSLDAVVHIPDRNNSWGNRKRPAEERDGLFRSIMRQTSWIAEDTGRPCFAEGLEQADTIILLEPSEATRKRRIIFRWIKQKLGIEKCTYKPRYAVLTCMFRWSKDYTLGRDGLKERLVPYRNKVRVFTHNRDIRTYLNEFGQAPNDMRGDGKTVRTKPAGQSNHAEG